MSSTQPPDEGVSTHIGRIAGVLCSSGFPTGDRAALRRMAPGQPPPLIFYRFALHYLPEHWEHRQEDWGVLVAGIATMAPTAHQPNVTLGRALATAGYSESRLERLLAAEDATRRTLLLRTARFLAAKICPFNWTDAAMLLLIRDETKRERLHRRIAGDFYRTLDQEQNRTVA